jgi:hypothetical protein
MNRKILSVIAGVITGFIVIFAGDAIIGKMGGERDMNSDTGAPGYVQVLMVISWLLSAFLGGLVAARINRVQWKQTALITGAILLGAALLNLAMHPQPAALWIAAIILYLPVSLLGGYTVRGPSVPVSRQTSI